MKDWRDWGYWSSHTRSVYKKYFSPCRATGTKEVKTTLLQEWLCQQSLLLYLMFIYANLMSDQEPQLIFLSFSAGRARCLGLHDIETKGHCNLILLFLYLAIWKKKNAWNVSRCKQCATHVQISSIWTIYYIYSMWIWHRQGQVGRELVDSYFITQTLQFGLCVTVV